MVIAFAIVWIIIGAVVVGYPLIAGRIRVGVSGSAPITRADDPRGFWRAYGLSTSLFLVVSAVAAWFAAQVVPR